MCRYYTSYEEGINGKCSDIVKIPSGSNLPYYRSAPVTNDVMVTSQYNRGVRSNMMSSGDGQYFVLEED